MKLEKHARTRMGDLFGYDDDVDDGDGMGPSDHLSSAPHT